MATIQSENLSDKKVFGVSSRNW